MTDAVSHVAAWLTEKKIEGPVDDGDPCPECSEAVSMVMGYKDGSMCSCGTTPAPCAHCTTWWYRCWNDNCEWESEEHKA